LRHDLLVLRPEPALRLFPGIRAMSWRQAMWRAVKGYGLEGDPKNFWQAVGGDQEETKTYWERGRIVEIRKRSVAADAETVFSVVSQLGGETGWLYADSLWRLRGLLDAWIGGVGMRRGRPNRPLQVGDPIDFWRVDVVEPPKLLRLKAEMRLPGEGWLQFHITPQSNGKSTLIQTAAFEPHGLLGLLYWYALLPFHALIFSGMCSAIAERAEGIRDRKNL
jgi:uncharacterized protein YndB with AHSA1/START domain